MSKSLGNLVFISDLLKVADPRAIRLALMHHHYRSGFEWHDTDIQDGNALLHRLVAAAQRATGPDPRAVRGPGAGRDRPRPRRAEGARGARRAGRRGALGRRRRDRTRRAAGAERPPRHQPHRPGLQLHRLRTEPARTSPVSSLLRTNRSPEPDWQRPVAVRADAGTTSRSRCRTAPTKELPKGSTAGDVAASIGKGLAKAAVAATVDGAEVDLTRPIEHDATVAIITANSDEGREVLRHSTSHVMAQAVFDLFPGAKYAIGPAIADGFYYDFELPDGQHFSETDLERIEARMREIVAEDEPFVREEYDFDRGLELFADQPFKQEIIRNVSSGAADDEDAGEVVGDGTVGVYKNLHADGTVAYVDLCRGPHVPSTGKLGAFKLTKVAGAYWRGDEKRPMLQRIYGTAWESDKALKEYLHRLEEAERRDHRKLGAELDLFSFPDEIGSGLAVFHPKGGTIRRIMEDYSRQRHIEAGYDFVNSPHITKSQPLRDSGHLDWYADGMYPPMELDGGTDYYLKPMNCPFHILIYESHTRSYRDLPLRLLRVRDGLPLREVGRRPRPDPRARHDPGRRAHLHDQGA